MLHFAYGSNLLLERIRLPERSPNAQPVAVARLDRWRLVFEKKGSDGSGKATLRLTGERRDAVHGVLYHLPAAERRRLDRAEGPGYAAHTVEVAVGDERRPAWLYLAVERFLDPRARPFRWYRGLVHAGARQHGLPAAYASAIEAVPTRRDPDRDRAGRMLRILDAAGFPAHP